ncbi:MAG: discoidin domain-containing protein [Verrucomicrobiota bacterium]
MRLSWVVLTLLAGLVPALLCSSASAQDSSPGAQAAARNLCPNPGFERLNPAGDNFPIGWGGPFNAFIDKDAHTGSIAIRMSCQASEHASLNSQTMAVRRGVLTFFYKAVRSGSGGDNLRVCVIGLNQQGIEVTRVCAPAAKAHVGDGQWHQAKLEFDFTRDFAVESVLIAPRINETGTVGDGEWLVDDIECIENRAGPRPEIEALHMPEPLMQPGRPAAVVIQVINNGDTPVPASRCRLNLSEGVELVEGPAELELAALPPFASQRWQWKIVARRECDVRIIAQWSAAGFAEGTSVQSEYKMACVAGGDLRRVCTGKGGFWRLMPQPESLQLSNNAHLEPLKTKKSSQLPDSMIGITAHLPRSRDFEVIFEPEHLIDGNPQTSWSARAHKTPVSGGIDWAEVDFAGPQSLREVRLVPYWRAEGFPLDFTVSVRSGGQWQKVRELTGVRLPASAGETNKTPYTIALPAPCKADAVRIEVTRCSHASSFFTEFYQPYYFRLSEIEAITVDGRNAALAAYGAKVKVSTTFRSYYNSPEVVRRTYPELYEMGVKWNRVGQWGDWTCWTAVEQEKGKYYMDPETDRAITKSVRNGVQILYTLDYGNPLYEATPCLGNPGPVWRHGHPFMGDGGPTKPESIAGFVNYARFVARHFKGRVKYYEIWNEENSWAWYGSPPDPVAFGTLLRETAKALKEVDPEIKVTVGGTAALAPVFISASLQQGGGKFLDGVAFHPYTMPYPEMGLGSLDVIDGKQQGRTPADLGFKTWLEMISFLRKTFSPFNPRFEYWANEWNAIPDVEDGLQSGFGELAEAKQAARFYLGCTLSQVRGVWWSLANENYEFAWAILRTGDLSRKPIFYTIRALSTVMAGARPDDSVRASLSGDAPELHCETLRGAGGETLVAVWSAVPPQDDYGAKRITLRIESPARKAELIDPLHSVVQKAVVRREGKTAVIEGVLAPDYPIIVRLR